MARFSFSRNFVLLCDLCRTLYFVPQVRLVWADSNRRPTLYKVTLPKQGSIQDLCRALERLAKVPHNHCLVIVDVYHNKFHKIFTGADSLKDINDKDVIFA